MPTLNWLRRDEAALAAESRATSYSNHAFQLPVFLSGANSCLQTVAKYAVPWPAIPQLEE
jgi:hypothetical protein